MTSLAARARLLALGGFLAIAQPAFAHEENSVGGGFMAGLTHPIFGVDHLLAMVAVGIWGAILGRPLIFILPVVFPAVMTVGAILGMADIAFPYVEAGIALSVLLLGVLIATATALPVWLASAIVGAFAIFHGFAHGQELPLASDPISYSAGFVLATGGLHLAGIGIGWLSSRAGKASAIPRGAGWLIAAAGAYFVYRTVWP